MEQKVGAGSLGRRWGGRGRDKQHPALGRSWEGHQAVQQLIKKSIAAGTGLMKIRNSDDCGVRARAAARGGLSRVQTASCQHGDSP